MGTRQLSIKEEQRLKKVFNGANLGKYNIAFDSFVNYALKNGYRPWKELMCYDKEIGYTQLSNIYFGYKTMPSDLLYGTSLDRQASEPEIIQRLRLLGRLTSDIADKASTYTDFIIEFSNSFSGEALDEIMAYLDEIQRVSGLCEQFLDNVEIIDNLVTPKCR